ncbi:hypothetical protein BGX26_002012, partial [Mortierella sp. AD094]
FEVQSFVSADLYSVSSNNSFTNIFSCTCADYGRHQIPCKHMYLAQRVYRSAQISYVGEPALAQEQDNQSVEIDRSLDFLGPNLEAELLPTIRLALEKTRAEVQEAKKVAREQAIRQEFEEYEAQLQELV